MSYLGLKEAHLKAFRKDVDLNRKYIFKYSKLSWKGTPIIASNMDGVGEINVAQKLTSYKVNDVLLLQLTIDQISTIYKNSDYHKSVLHLVVEQAKIVIRD